MGGGFFMQNMLVGMVKILHFSRFRRKKAWGVCHVEFVTDEPGPLFGKSRNSLSKNQKKSPNEKIFTPRVESF